MARRTFMRNVRILGLISITFVLILKTAEGRTCWFYGDTKEVFSNDYPHPYTDNYHCILKIMSKPGCYIKIKFNDLYLETCNNCQCDYVALYDGESNTDPLLGKFCGRNEHLNLSITSTSHIVLTEFRTDHSKTYRGFKFTYSLECPQFLPTTTSVQSLVISGEPAENLMKTWIFETDHDYTINLELKSFQLSTFPDCNSNYVALYNGQNENDPLLGRFCSSIPPTISSTTNHMLMLVKFNENFPNVFLKAEYRAEFNVKSISDETKRSFLDYFLNTRHNEPTLNKWGPDVGRTAVALLLGDPQFFAPGNETGEEIAYELTLQLKSKLVLRKQISTADLALFVNALTAACIDPRNFFGVDIVSELRKRVDDSNYTNPFFVLTLCNAGEKIEFNDVDKLQLMFGEKLQPSWTGIQAMIVLALKCISEQSYFNLETDIDEMVSELKSKQQRNSTIDNLKNTALVIQAIIATENYKTDFNFSTAINSMLNSTSTSIKEMYYILPVDTSIEEMYYILPVLTWKTLLNISSDHCTSIIKTDLEVPKRIPKQIEERIPVEFSIVIGDEMDYLQTWRVRVPSNYTFYQVLENITSSELSFKVKYVFSEGKPYVAGLANFQNSMDTGKFWFLYTKSLPSGEIPILLKKSPADIQINETNNLFLWYKSLSCSSTQDISSNVTNFPSYTTLDTTETDV